MTALLRCANIDIAVSECVLVTQLSFALPAASLTCVLGRNGTGKSLTLHTLAGLRDFSPGSLQLNERHFNTLTRRQIAQQLAFVAQDSEEPFPVTVLECAVSGRHPHIDFWQWESAADYDIAQQALTAVDLSGFADRSVQTLSGGEKRRLAIAVALAQTPQVFVLDEPINHLDPQHQLQVLKLMRQKADEGCAVIMSLHDPSVAAQFSDYALLLFGDGTWQHGATNDILSGATMTQLYRTPMQEFEWQGKRKFISV